MLASGLLQGAEGERLQSGVADGGGNDDEPSGTAAPAAPTTTAAQEASGAIVAVASSKPGDILVDADGRTLYAFTKDKGDQSVCSGECASNWPALTGTATAGPVPRPGCCRPACSPTAAAR